MKTKKEFDCTKCPGYCCSYDSTAVTRKDITRLADHFGMTHRQAKKKFTAKLIPSERSLKQKPDDKFKKICIFFDTKKRQCSVYDARPAVCRKYPYGNSCGYFDYLQFERKLQGTKRLYILAQVIT